MNREINHYKLVEQSLTSEQRRNLADSWPSDWCPMVAYGKLRILTRHDGVIIPLPTDVEWDQDKFKTSEINRGYWPIYHRPPDVKNSGLHIMLICCRSIEEAIDWLLDEAISIAFEKRDE